MTRFRFMHAADIHLDSPLIGLANIEGRVAQRVRTAPRTAFEKLVDRTIDDEVDFLVIAGDLYDGTWRDYKTGLFFAEQMGRLNQAHIPVYVLHGNHDAESQITKPLVLPENVSTFSPRKPQTFFIQDLKVALHGQSFRDKAVLDNLVPGYPEPIEDAFNIGVLHTALGGMGEHANYAPCNLSELVAKGYNYWALGHVHQHQVMSEQPYVVFPGNLQGRNVRETGPKGACLVTVDDGEVVDLATLELDVVRWSVLNVDITSAGNYMDVVDLIREALIQAVQESNGRLLAARIILQGRTELNNQLVANCEELTAEARSLALGFGDEVAWVERVRVQTMPVTDNVTLASREDALSDLQRMLEKADSDVELLKQLEEDIGKLIHQLPYELRVSPDDKVFAAAVEGNYASVIEQVLAYINARLLVEDN